MPSFMRRWEEEKLIFRQWTSWSMWSAFSWMSKINNPSSSSSSSSTLHTHTHTHLTHSLPFTHVGCHLLLLWTAKGGAGGGGNIAAAAAADLSANNEFIRRVCHSRSHNNWRHGGVNKQSVLLSIMNIIMNVCMRVCMHVCIYVCIYVGIFILFSSLHFLTPLFSCKGLAFSKRCIETSHYSMKNFIHFLGRLYDLFRKACLPHSVGFTRIRACVWLCLAKALILVKVRW